MKWIEAHKKLPTNSKPIIIDCVEGIGEGYYRGKGVFRFIRFGADVELDDVYAWMEMPKESNVSDLIVVDGE